MIRVVLTDDHPVVRVGLTKLLATAPDIHVIGVATCGSEGVSMARALDPDVVMMDLSMPDIDGQRATELILADRPQARVVILTAMGDRAKIGRALECGAVGALLKDAAPAEIIAAVRAAATTAS